LRSFQLPFNNFLSFVNDPLFQEIPPAIRKAIDELHAKHPGVTLPKNFNGVMGLHARCFDLLTAPGPGPKKGMPFFLLFSVLLLILFKLPLP
jgi:hypothetical protein